MTRETVTDLRLPWKMHDAPHADCFWVDDATGSGVFSCGQHISEGVSEPAVAAYIVKAVNNHEAMVQTVQDLLLASDDYPCCRRAVDLLASLE